MSVIFFSAEELGNIARSLAPGASDYERSKFQSCLAALHIISKANAQAYSASYPIEYVDGWSMAAIGKAAPSPVYIQPGRACNLAALLFYNCIANDGKEFADSKGVLRALNVILEGLLRLAAKRAYASEKRRPIVPASTPGQPISILDMIPRQRGTQ